MCRIFAVREDNSARHAVRRRRFDYRSCCQLRTVATLLSTNAWLHRKHLYAHYQPEPTQSMHHNPQQLPSPTPQLTSHSRLSTVNCLVRTHRNFVTTRAFEWNCSPTI
uniref:Uncharacterized protein n=1 Tax=Ascaris lumbricoides TaxID=6252 RepID=A0A0M3HQ96_ASCLU